jgi:catechol 2,3-dioxygenase
MRAAHYPEAMATIDPALRIRSVELAVGELQRSADFYERVLGLPAIAREEGRAWLGTDARSPALVLSEIARPTPLPVSSTGLYHVAWLHPSRAALAASVRRVAASGWPFEGAADHGVSEALYLSDPDGLGIELYADRPRERWPQADDGGVAMVTLSLDLDDLLAQASETPTPAMAPGTSVGHVHLKVADVARASSFYRDALGFQEQARRPSASFLAAGGYHHHVGLNSWQSAGAGAAPDTAPGLRRVDFALADGDAVEALARGLLDAGSTGGPVRGDDDSLTVRDPDGQLLLFAAAGAGRAATVPAER